MAMLKLYRRYSSGGVESVLAVLQGRGLLKQATRCGLAGSCTRSGRQSLTPA